MEFFTCVSIKRMVSSSSWACSQCQQIALNYVSMVTRSACNQATFVHIYLSTLDCSLLYVIVLLYSCYKKLQGSEDIQYNIFNISINEDSRCICAVDLLNLMYFNSTK